MCFAEPLSSAFSTYGRNSRSSVVSIRSDCDGIWPMSVSMPSSCARVMNDSIFEASSSAGMTGVIVAVLRLSRGAVGWKLFPGLISMFNCRCREVR